MPAYCTIEEVRAEGITPEQAADTRLTRLIAKASAYIDLVTGRTFGGHDEQGEEILVPILIKDVAIKLVIRDLPLLSDFEGQEEKRRGRILSETTDGHSYTLANTVAASGVYFTGDPEIDNILLLFGALPFVSGV